MACAVVADEHDVLRQVLCDMSDESLRQMGTRIARSHKAAESALHELEAEKENLRGENKHLNGTIGFMMRELHKLNISGVNVPEPRIAGETAIDYVGRLWEKMRPRDNTVVVSEHVSELRLSPKARAQSPKASDNLREKVAGRILSFSGALGQVTNNIMGAPQDVFRAEELGAQLTARSRRVAGQFSALYSAFGQAPAPVVEAPKQKKKEGKKGGKKNGKKAVGDGLAERGPAEILGAPERAKGLHKQLSKETKKLQAEVTKQFEGAWSLLAGVSSSPGIDVAAADKPGEEKVVAEDAAGAKGTSSMRTLMGYWRSPGRKQDSGSAERALVPDQAASSSGGSSSSSGSSTAASSTPASRENSGEGSPHAAAVATVDGDLRGVEAAPASEPTSAAVDIEQPPGDSTLLIQVKLTLGDGSVQTVQVRAADRCKEVAARFVREHSLKAWFEAPLKAYLMDAENNAERFPVMLEADLMEIRRQHNAAK